MRYSSRDYKTYSKAHPFERVLLSSGTASNGNSLRNCVDPRERKREKVARDIVNDPYRWKQRGRTTPTLFCLVSWIDRKSTARKIKGLGRLLRQNKIVVIKGDDERPTLYHIRQVKKDFVTLSPNRFNYCYPANLSFRRLGKSLKHLSSLIGIKWTAKISNVI